MATKEPGRIKTAPVLSGSTMGTLFDDAGVSTEAVDDTQLEKLRAAFPGVTFSAYKEPKAAAEDAGDAK